MAKGNGGAGREGRGKPLDAFTQRRLDRSFGGDRGKMIAHYAKTMLEDNRRYNERDERGRRVYSDYSRYEIRKGAQASANLIRELGGKPPELEWNL